jgi:hypothetical protein
LIRETSSACARVFPVNSLDLIYIDGDHTYAEVMKDLNSCWNIANHERGIICGDDIGWPGVRRACDEFFGKKNLEYRLICKRGYENLPVWYFDFANCIE